MKQLKFRSKPITKNSVKVAEYYYLESYLQKKYSGGEEFFVICFEISEITKMSNRL